MVKWTEQCTLCFSLKENHFPQEHTNHQINPLKKKRKEGKGGWRREERGGEGDGEERGGEEKDPFICPNYDRQGYQIVDIIKFHLPSSHNFPTQVSMLIHRFLPLLATEANIYS